MSTNRYHYLFIITAIVLASCGPTTPPIPGPLVPTGKVETIELGTTVENVWNCGNGGGTIIKHPSRSASTGHAIEWGVDGTIGYGVKIGEGGVIPGGVDLSQSLSGHYIDQFDNGSQQGTSWDLPAEPNTIVDYTLDWRETWETGYVDVLLPNNSSQRIDLRYRTNIESTMIDKRVTLCPGSEGASNSTIALSDSFSGSNSGYDTNAWSCSTGNCDTQNMFQQNGTLVFKLNTSEISPEIWGGILQSQATWKTSSFISVEGRLQIGANTRGGAWLGLDSEGWSGTYHGPSCSIFTSEVDKPIIECNLGPDYNKEYVTADIPVKFETWYLIRMDLDPITQEYRYYLDNQLIGQNKPNTWLDSVSAILGMWRRDNQSVDIHIDDISVKTKP
jgi:hypothetical protein